MVLRLWDKPAEKVEAHGKIHVDHVTIPAFDKMHNKALVRVLLVQFGQPLVIPTPAKDGKVDLESTILNFALHKALISEEIWGKLQSPAELVLESLNYNPAPFGEYL